MKAKLVAVMLLVFGLTPILVSAQSPSVQWNRWDAQITVPASGDQMQIAETQEVNVTGGTVSHGTRSWTDAVQVQSVYLVAGNSSTPQQLTQDTSNQPNTYTLSQSNGETTLEYTLPTPQASGNTYVVQINYTAPLSTNGLVDWNVIPADHDFPINSSTVTVHFPDGQAPDSSLVQVTQGNATATVSGNDLIIKSQGAIPAQQAFAIQVPFGAGVGAAGQSGNNTVPNSGNTSPVNPTTPGTDTGTLQLPGIGTILLIICVVGFLLLVGGGTLLRGLLGGVLGGALGGGQPGGQSGLGGLGGLGGGPQVGGNSFTGDNEANSPVQRGFRPSANQDRELPNIHNDKGSGGSARFS